MVSAGGYHHHLGLNTWMGAGAPPPPPGSLGMRHFTISLPSAEASEVLASRATEAGTKVEEIEDVFLFLDPSGKAVSLIHD